MPFVVGETIGAYRILEQLGRGGMATVFKAYHPALDRYVALKALHPAFMEDPNFLARFQREARVVARLEHPNIVPIYDFSEYEGRPYLVMKFIEGLTLKARHAGGPIGGDELMRVAEAVGEALSYAHQKGILHRDVKPSNVLLGYDERIYLADFGLARIAQAGESTLSSDMLLGTPQYISPEQAMGVVALDEGTDIYSFGVMLYEFVVGKVPFSADTPFSIIHDHIYTPLPLPRVVNPDVPEAVERVLLKALAKERKDRFESALGLVAALRTAIAAAPEAEEKSELYAHSHSSVVEVDRPRAGVAEVPGSQPRFEVVQPEPSVAAAGTISDTENQTEKAKPEEAVTKVDPARHAPVTTAAGKAAVRPGPRNRKWWMVGAALVGILGIVGALVVFSNLGDRQNGQGGAVSLTQEMPLEEGQTAGPAEEILRRIEEDPGEANLYLDLAAVYFEQGQEEAAYEAIRQALTLPDLPEDVVMRAADLAASRENWTMLASVLLSYLQNGPAQVPESLYERFNEAAYRATNDPESGARIPIERIAVVDEALEKVVKARYILRHDSPEQAKTLLGEMLTQVRAGMPEALLLQVEVYLKLGDEPNARQTKEQLQNRPDVPEWVRVHLDRVWGYRGDAADEPQVKPGEAAWAHLDLLDVKLSQHDYEGAEVEMRAILESGSQDPQLFFNTGDILSKHGAWPYATILYQYAARLHPEANQKTIERLQMAAYHSGLAEDGFEILSKPDVGLAPELLFVVDARHELYFGDPGLADEKIQTLVEKDPFLVQELLLMAEKHIKDQDYQAAAELLNRMANNEGNPFWVREEARVMLEKLP